MDLNWYESGLNPAICQDASTGEVLMLAWMNREAYRLTRETGQAHFWSRSREKLWRKGETSGNVLHVRQIQADCDADTLLLQVEPAGPACHTGSRSCFERAEETGAAAEKPFSLRALAAVIAGRAEADPAESYTARLFSEGRDRIAQKVGEEAVELILAAAGSDRPGTIAESADLLYHLLVLLEDQGIPLDQVIAELARRHRA